MKERLYIVDGHGYIFRAHYGLMNISRGERREGGRVDLAARVGPDDGHRVLSPLPRYSVGEG